MRIAIPLAQGRLSPHFGHCDEFAVIDVDEQSKEIQSTELHEPPAHEPGALPRWLSELKVKVVIAGGIGVRAQGLLTQSGIEVITGAAGDEPKQIVREYLDGTLSYGENACDH